MENVDAVPSEVSDVARMLQAVAVPANTEVVNAALSLVVALAKATVPGADGVSVMLSRHGTLTTVAASDETISGMDADQYATGEGPCVSAASLGHRIYVDALDAEPRWPEFIPRARKRGINSILSMPLLTRGRPLGSLNIYSTTPGAFAESDQSLATLCAQQASDVLLASSAVDIAPEDFSARIGDALKGRQSITLAVGVFMAREAVSIEDGYGMLLRASQENALTMREQAEVVVASTQST
jgi:putative methionine-R-sulfoxide reductase with GAF domain